MRTIGGSKRVKIWAPRTKSRVWWVTARRQVGFWTVAAWLTPLPDIEIRPYQPGDRDPFAELVSRMLAEYGFSVDPVLESDLSSQL